MFGPLLLLPQYPVLQVVRRSIYLSPGHAYGKIRYSQGTVWLGAAARSCNNTSTHLSIYTSIYPSISCAYHFDHLIYALLLDFNRLQYRYLLPSTRQSDRRLIHPILCLGPGYTGLGPSIIYLSRHPFTSIIIYIQSIETCYKSTIQGYIS
jgi:hypothetical protein